MNLQEQIEKRNKLSKEVEFLKNEVAKKQTELAIKQRNLNEACPCEKKEKNKTCSFCEKS
tara:strand:- start:44302 stop:44481 length:180 start_codon:yes stop_codon:yes gene_type:complete